MLLPQYLSCRIIHERLGADALPSLSGGIFHDADFHRIFSVNLIGTALDTGTSDGRQGWTVSRSAANR
jgi:hypothetical protein